MKTLLEVKALVKTFNLSKKQQRIQKTKEKKKVAVNDLSFQAYEGEIYGLLGPNGAGKTTTLRILAGLIKADQGEAIVDGVSVTKNPDLVHSKIGFLTSELKLEDFFTPNYLYDYFSELHHVDKQVAKTRKEELFSKFGIDEFREVKVAELSTGMKQKVSLVISIVHNPNIIIFDEPTNGLDIITAKIVTDFLIELKKEGKTLILSTHIFSLVEKLCDRVGIIIDGKMAYEGYVSDINKESSLEDLFFNLYETSRGESHE
ncbi:MAG: ATP-binding cassette domain-containing protein [Acholeplasma sp.]|nr:ATP-binding cassette domain-containing protein [Acholeplasma sp.]